MLLTHGWIEQHRHAVSVLDLRGLVAGRERPEDLGPELLARVRLCRASADETPSRPRRGSPSPAAAPHEDRLPLTQ